MHAALARTGLLAPRSVWRAAVARLRPFAASKQAPPPTERTPERVVYGFAQPLLATAFADHPRVRHIKIEDGSGRPLGRSFGVRLWPTLVFLREGREVARLVRPRDAQVIRAALQEIDPP